MRGRADMGHLPLYLKESPGSQQADRAFLQSTKGHLVEVQLFMDFLMFIWAAFSIRTAVLKENLPIRAREVEKL